MVVAWVGISQCGAAHVNVKGVSVEYFDQAEGVCRPSKDMSMAGAAGFGGCEDTDAEEALDGPAP